LFTKTFESKLFFDKESLNKLEDSKYALKYEAINDLIIDIVDKSIIIKLNKQVIYNNQDLT